MTTTPDTPDDDTPQDQPLATYLDDVEGDDGADT